MALLANIIYYVIPFIILLGILVFVHEFGHFIVARLLGVRVVAFSIGFGKKLWCHTDKKGTCWQLAAIPLGGFCQFLGDADASSSTVDSDLETLSEEDKKQAFHLQKAWKKILIVIAGPLFNYLFAILLFIGIFWAYGRIIYPPVVGEVMPDSAAAEVGIKSGDRIVSVNGHNIIDFHELSNEIMLAQTDPVEIAVERVASTKLFAEKIDICGKESAQKMIGIRVKLPENKQSSEAEPAGECATAEVLPVIGEVIPNSPAQMAGLRVGDFLFAVNNTDLHTFADLQKYVREHQDDEINLLYKRNLIFEVNLKNTQYEDEIGGKQKRRMLGVKSKPELSTSEDLDFKEAFNAGFAEAYDITAMTLRGVWQMISGQRSGQDVGGIIRIAEMSGDVSKHSGFLGFIYFMALISVNLGLINLFPIPVLDGGNLVVFLVELVIGHELKPKFKDYIFKFGIFVVLAIMVLATWNDIVHLIGRIFD